MSCPLADEIAGFRARSRNRSGAVSIETVMTWVAVASGLAFMAFYLQRGAQGAYFSTASSIGQQFDPRPDNPYFEQKTLAEFAEVALQGTLAPMVEAGLLAPFTTEGGYLFDIPKGPVPREPAATFAQVTTTWRQEDTAAFTDFRDP